MAEAHSHIYDSHGPVVQLVHYIRKRRSELHEMLVKSRAERLMWTDWNDREGIPDRARSYMVNRVDKLSERIRTDTGEFEMLGELYESLESCEKCGGLGELRDVDGCDSSHYRDCQDCGGSGSKKTP